MALIDCPTCDQTMAGSARRCPHCGAPSPRAARNRRTVILAAVLTAVIAGVCLLLLLALVSNHASVGN